MEDKELENRLLKVLMDHVGRANAIGMGELYESVFGISYGHRINDTRGLRKLITKLRQQGMRICSLSNQEGGGYYLASARSEMSDYIERLKKQGLKKLAQAAALEKKTLPEFMGQVLINLEGESCGQN